MSDAAGRPVDPAPELTDSDAWRALVAHHREVGGTTLRQLFASDTDRAARLTFIAGDLLVDLSKHLVTDESLELLVALAEHCGLGPRRDAMFAGEHINTTEDRAVLHVALRMPAGTNLVVDDQDVVADVHRVLDRMSELADQIRDGRWTGHDGRRIKTVINIGIGGSDLGPAMAYQALADFASPDVECRFVSNVDPTDLWNQIHDLDPAETLFVVCSKTFTTLETMTNAAAARQWLLQGLGLQSAGSAGSVADDDADADDGSAVAKHFIAVSANSNEVAKFGIDPSNMLEFWDWVGGRYSFDSAIGFTLMIAIGPDAFDEMLAGAHAVDEHFRTAPLRSNVPVLQGLLNIWYRNFFGFQSHAVLPYSQRLARFPAYLQQLTMESNGKSVRRDGTPVQAQSGEVFWGEPGTNGQHAFYQLLHQGTTPVPADFIAFAEPAHDNGHQHDLLVANCFAQSAVLAFGRTADEVASDGTPAEVVPHKVMPGNRPTTTILAPRLTPSVLGQLVAIYEHTVFTEGLIWGIDSFDQWGVELGKAMANQLLPALVASDHAESTARLSGQDSSTASLVGKYRELRA